MAADYKQNPFTLTYEGVLAENAKGILGAISASPVVLAAPVSPPGRLMMYAERDWL